MRQSFVAVCSIAFVCSCSATINQASFAPKSSTKAPATILTAPFGYQTTEQLVDLGKIGKIHVVRLSRSGNRSVLIYSGGNGNFVSALTKRSALLAKAANTDLILYDYSGRGGTTVPATIDANLAMTKELPARLRDMGWLGPGPVFSYGFSFGGAQAAAMVRSGGFQGLIIEASASDYAAVGHDFIPGGLRPFVKLKVNPDLKRFDYYGYARDAKIPVLLLSGRDDKVVRHQRVIDFAERLKRDGVNARFVATPGGHGDSLLSAEGQAALRSFVAAVEK